MRLSTTQIYQQNINTILDMQSKVSDLNLRIASGKKILKPSDDPAGSVRILNLSDEIARTEQYARNIDAARVQLSQEESILAEQGNVLQRIRELVIQAGNDTLNQGNREGIAAEIRALREEMINLANTRDAAGEYIFSGYQVDSEPFSDVGGVMQYAGDQGQRFVQVGSRTQVAMRDSGYEVFQNIRNGNGVFSTRANPANGGNAVMDSSLNGEFIEDTYAISFSQASATVPMIYEVRDSSGGLISTGNYTPGEAIGFNGVQVNFTGQPADGDSFTVSPAARQDMFTSVQNIVDTLETRVNNGSDLARLHNELNESLREIDGSLEHLLDVRGKVGVRLNTLDTQLNVNENSLVQLEQSMSNLADVDYAQAISDMNQQLTALQAAQQIYVKIQDLSLFRFLR